MNADNKLNDVSVEIISLQESTTNETELNEWVPLFEYAPQFCDTEFDFPDESVSPQFFQHHQSMMNQQGQIEDLILVHKVIDSGIPNRWGCRIPLKTPWKIENFRQLLAGYHDQDLLEWLTYGFPISRDDEVGNPTPNSCNHMGANMFLQAIDEYVRNEVKLGATLGPFSIPPFVYRMGVSPLSTQPKRESGKCRVILDLSFPPGSSVNDGIEKIHYCGEEIKLTYPMIDTLANRIATLVSQGKTVLIWKKDLLRAFRQVFLCPRDYSLIGYRWQNLLYFDKVVPMGLQSAAYICQRITNAIVYVQNTFGCWSINYLDDFGSAEDTDTAWYSYNTLSNIFNNIGSTRSTRQGRTTDYTHGVSREYC